MQVPLDGQGRFNSVTEQDPAAMYFFGDLTMVDVECIKIEAESTDLEPVTLILDEVSFCYEFRKLKKCIFSLVVFPWEISNKTYVRQGKLLSLA